MTGTFTKAMPIGDGKAIPPTGKSFKLDMATVGHWKNGKLIEESLFWDNQALMKQIGVWPQTARFFEVSWVNVTE